METVPAKPGRERKRRRKRRRKRKRKKKRGKGISVKREEFFCPCILAVPGRGDTSGCSGDVLNPGRDYSREHRGYCRVHVQRPHFNIREISNVSHSGAYGQCVTTLSKVPLSSNA